MTNSSTPSPDTLSIFLNGDKLFEINDCLLNLKIGAVIYCALALVWLGDTCLRFTFKMVDRIDNYLDSFTHHSSDHRHNDKDHNATHGNKESATQDPEQRPSVSEGSINISSIPFAPCIACHSKLKALSPSSLDTNLIIELPILDPIASDTTNTSSVAEGKPSSYAKDALASLADDLEFDVAHLNQAEAKDMLVELRDLRSVLGSRTSLFTTRDDAFDSDSWYGEACLIDALMWLLRKRFPDQNDPEPAFSGFESAKEEVSGGRQSPRVDLGPTTGLDSTASPRRCALLPHTQDIINSVTQGLGQQLRGLYSFEIDFVLAMLKRKKKSLAARGQAHTAAKVGLMDGIMLLIRQEYDCSQPVVDEQGYDSFSDIEHEPLEPSPSGSPHHESGVPAWKAEIRDWLKMPVEVSREMSY